MRRFHATRAERVRPRRLTTPFLWLAVALAAGLLAPGGARAMSSYYAASCTSCHDPSPTTCNGCHHHRGTVNGSLGRTTFAPGEAMTITVDAGQRSGFWRAAVLDGANQVVGTASATASGPATVTVAAPRTAGTYAWKVAWYGNAYTETPAAASWVADAGNAGHGYVTAALATFSVQATPTPVPVASLSPAALDLGTVAVGQASTRSATLSNTGNAELVVNAAAPCSGTNVASLTLSPGTAFTVPSGGAATLTVSFAPTSAGAASACWALATNDPAHPAFQLTASGTAEDQPPPPSCTGCHAIPPATGRHAAHVAEGCGACHGAGYSSTTVVASTHDDGTVDLASSAGWDRATTSCANACHGARSWGTTPPPPSQSCTTCHGTPPGSGRHPAHATQSCGACHGAGYSPTTVVAATHQDGKVTIGAEAGWSSTARSCANACHASRSWGGGTTGACGSCHAMPPTSGRHALHRSEFIACVLCHGWGYSTKTVNATSHNDGKVDLTWVVGWNATQRSCATLCHGRQSWGGAPGPGAGQSCTSCHRIPPASGEHARHQSKRIACGSCHGAGYSGSTVNAATHRNGKVDLSSRIGFDAGRRSCASACHGKESWVRSNGGGDDHEKDDFAIAPDGVPDAAPESAAGGTKAGGGCGNGGASASVLGLLGAALAGLRRRRGG